MLKTKNPKKNRKEKIKCIYHISSELYNNFLETNYHEYNGLSDGKRNKIDPKYDPKNLFLEGYDYSVWSENEEELSDQKELADKEETVDLSDVLPLEGDEEEVKGGKGLKVLTPNKLLTRLLMLLAQIKAGSNSCKLKNEIRQVLYLLYQHNKILKRCTTI